MKQQPAGPRATPHVWNGVAQGPARDSARGEARGAVSGGCVLWSMCCLLFVNVCKRVVYVVFDAVRSQE